MTPIPPPGGQPSSETRTATRRRLQRLAWLYDSSIPLPGGFRIGLDPLVGLIPGAGDVLGLLMSGHVLLESLRLGAPRALLVKMVGNVAADTLLGSVPLLGDLFDFVFKSNVRNLRLLEQYLDTLDGPRAVPTPPARAGWLAGLIVVLLLAGFGTLLWGAWSLMGWLARTLFGG